MIRITRKRPIFTAVVLLLLTGMLVLTWELCDWPPPRLILKYGFPPAGGPTGRCRTIGHLEYIEVAPGYCRIRRLVRSGRSTSIPWLPSSGVLSVLTRIDRTSKFYADRWVEVDHAFWISKTPAKSRTYVTTSRPSGFIKERKEDSRPDRESMRGVRASTSSGTHREPIAKELEFVGSFGVFGGEFAVVYMDDFAARVLVGPGWNRVVGSEFVYEVKLREITAPEKRAFLRSARRELDRLMRLEQTNRKLSTNLASARALPSPTPVLIWVPPLPRNTSSRER